MATWFGWFWFIGKRRATGRKHAPSPVPTAPPAHGESSSKIESLESRTFLSASAQQVANPAAATATTISFTATQRLSTVSAFNGYIAVGDFTGNGLEDFASTRGTEDNNEIFIYLNNGNDTFTRAETYHVNEPRGIVAGDFNNDGITDLAVVAENQNNGSNASNAAIYILYGNGDGTFQAPVKVSHTRMGFGAITAADLTNNGQLDLAVTNNRAVTVYMNQGNGTFANGVRYSTGVGNAAYLSAEDLSGDGVDDLVVGKGINPYVAVLMGQTIGGQATGTFATAVKYKTHNLPISVAVADLTGAGGLPDIIVGNNGFRQGISVLMNNGDGTFAPQVVYQAGNFVRYVTTGNFEGNGTVDIASTDFDGPLFVFPNDGTGTLGSPQTFYSGKQGDFLIPIDLGNGLTSLLVSHSGDVSVLLNTTQT